jgi:hypothetical protein
LGSALARPRGRAAARLQFMRLDPFSKNPMTDPSQQASPSGIRTVTAEALVALVMLALGLVTVYESWRLGASWTDDGPGAGYFPFYIGLVISLASVGILFKALRASKGHTEIFVDGESLRRVMQVLIPAVLYVLAVQFIGIYVASALYIALFMVLLGKYSWAKAIVVGIAVCTLFFFMFEVWFKVPLFKGALDPTGFLGY